MTRVGQRPLGHPQTPPSAPPALVLLVIDSPDGGGAERYVVDLAIALHRRGWPVEVACSTGGVRAGALADAGVPVSILLDTLVKRRVSRRYGRALRRLIEDRRPALVHAHLYASATAAAQATRDLARAVGHHRAHGGTVARATGAGGEPGSVTFTGFRADAPQIIAGVDLLAVPSRSDGSPLVVCEAIAAGIPVIASRVDGLPDLVADGRTGLLVRPGQAENLARAMVSLLLDPTGAGELGTRGREVAATRTHAHLVDRMEGMYRCLDGPAVRSG
ncbi:MAG: glycosyltransferase [Actinomycetota bacterium]|nr:glycosyltransferase [Actinomycetota bacterium]